MLYNHHHSSFPEFSLSSQKKAVLIKNRFVSTNLPILSVTRMKQYLFFYAWLILLRIMFSKFIYVVACI